MVYLTRIEKFNAAHKLWVKSWSEDKNIAVFGKCANKNYHGHNFTLHVTVKGVPDPVTGFIINVRDLSVIIQEVIIEKLDHLNLNLDVDMIPGDVQPTIENLVVHIWKELQPHLVHCQLHKLLLEETDKIYAEYFGE